MVEAVVAELERVVDRLELETIVVVQNTNGGLEE